MYNNSHIAFLIVIPVIGLALEYYFYPLLAYSLSIHSTPGYFLPFIFTINSLGSPFLLILALLISHLQACWFAHHSSNDPNCTWHPARHHALFAYAQWCLTSPRYSSLNSPHPRFNYAYTIPVQFFILHARTTRAFLISGFNCSWRRKEEKRRKYVPRVIIEQGSCNFYTRAHVVVVCRFTPWCITNARWRWKE